MNWSDIAVPLTEYSVFRGRNPIIVVNAIIATYFAIIVFMPVVLAQDTGVHPKGERLFSIAVTPSELKNPNNFWQNYESALDLAIATGIDLPGELSFIWSNVERRSLFGRVSYQDENSLRLIEMLEQKGMPVVITLTPFETTNNRIPKDLQDLAFNHEDVIRRFRRFIDWVYKVTDGLEVVSVVLGNEYDIYLAFEAAAGNDPWREFEGLAAETMRYVKSLERWQSLPFALETTYNGLTGTHWQALQRINQLSDIIGVSYYPVGEAAVFAPTIIEQHLASLFEKYPDKQIDFYQYGYPSSERIGSSLEKQRRFVEETFKAWDNHSDKIRLITFTWLYDIQSGVLENVSSDVLGEELSPTEAFIEFLGSLGLHGTSVGSEKPAFDELKYQLLLRGWSDQGR